MLKYKVKIPSASGITHTHIKIPLTMDNHMVDQSEIIERKFVDVEVKKAINPILDYEKIKFAPVTTAASSFVNRLEYVVTLLSGDTYNSVGFTDNDIIAQTNAFTQTFLKLSFYDNDHPTRQQLISFITLFPQLEDGDSDSTKKLTFVIGNPKQRTSEISTFEGFHIFHYSDEVDESTPKELYMKAEFNNAKTGKITNLMASSSAQPIEVLVNQLHTKYTLKKDSRGYYYEISNIGGLSNVTNNTSYIKINLYEIDAT